MLVFKKMLNLKSREFNMKQTVNYKGVISLFVLLLFFIQPLAVLASPSILDNNITAEQTTVLSLGSEDETALILSLVPLKKLKYLQFSASQAFEQYATQKTREMKQSRSYPVLSPGLHLPFIIYKISPTQYSADG